jgi:phage shock protein A
MSQEITHLKESLQAARTESSAAATRLAQAETGRHTLVHQTESLTAQCKQLANHNEWLNGEVDRKGVEHREFRREKGDQVAKLQQDVDRLTHEANAASLKCAGFEKKANDLETKYSLAVDKIKLVGPFLNY